MKVMQEAMNVENLTNTIKIWKESLKFEEEEKKEINKRITYKRKKIREFEKDLEYELNK